MCILNDSLQINHNLYKLAHLGNHQIQPVRLRTKAPAGTTSSDGSVTEWGGLGDQGWQLLVTKRDTLGDAAGL